MKHDIKFGALTLLVLLSAVASLVIVSRDDTGAIPRATLADKINSACKPGYTVNDWTSGGEYDPLPPGQVKVTCARQKFPYDLYYVAVER